MVDLQSWRFFCSAIKFWTYVPWNTNCIIWVWVGYCYKSMKYDYAYLQILRTPDQLKKRDSWSISYHFQCYFIISKNWKSHDFCFKSKDKYESDHYNSDRLSTVELEVGVGEVLKIKFPSAMTTNIVASFMATWQCIVPQIMTQHI